MIVRSSTTYCQSEIYTTEPPPFKITDGQVLLSLPFVGNELTTFGISGKELKDSLEAGLFLIDVTFNFGGFAQISGFCYTYDIAAPSFNRVVSAVMQNADGSCDATQPINLNSNNSPYQEFYPHPLHCHKKHRN